MPSFGPESAQCLVFTFKEGLLSAIAHDLKLRVGSFSVELAEDSSRLEARFDARSLKVVCAMHSGVEAPRALSDRDRRTIEANLADEVLDARRHPEIRFVSSAITRQGAHATVEGSLSLHGRSRAITAHAALGDGRWSSRIRIHQPDFAIRPYSAMLGTLRVQPDLLVELSLPA